MKIFKEDGYLDMGAIMGAGYPFTIVCGGRGTGKTFAALSESIKDKVPFMLMRRLQTQIDMINKPEFSPFKAHERVYGWHIGLEKISKNNSAIYQQEETGEGYKSVGCPIGYTAALATISNMRGFDASDVQRVIFDEFIPEKHERPIKNEASAIYNAYETINRNRELNGEKPLQMVFLANSNRLDNPLFMELRIVTRAERMLKTGQHVWVDEKRGIMLVMFSDSPISEKKENTSLYKLTSGSEYAAMALRNDFNTEDTGSIKVRPLGEYNPIVKVGEITIYRHKRGGQKIYVSAHKTGTPPEYGTGEIELGRFCRAYNWLWLDYLESRVEFESTMCELLFQNYFR